jgi:hypothetical protein
MATVVSPVSLFSRADFGYIGSGILMGSALFMSSDPVARLVERNSPGPQNPALLPRHETRTKVSKIAQTGFQLPRKVGLP